MGVSSIPVRGTRCSPFPFSQESRIWSKPPKTSHQPVTQEYHACSITWMTRSSPKGRFRSFGSTGTAVKLHIMLARVGTNLKRIKPLRLVGAYLMLWTVRRRKNKSQALTFKTASIRTSTPCRFATSMASSNSALVPHLVATLSF
jgi:hypothetical protein